MDITDSLTQLLIAALAGAALAVGIALLWLRTKASKSNSTSDLDALVVKTMSDGVVLIQNGKVRSMNHSACTITGFDATQTEQINIDEVFGDSIALRHLFSDPKEFSIQRADGNSVLIELSIKVVVTESNPLLIVTLRDLTELKHAQILLSQQAHVIDKTDTFVFVANADNELEWCNPRFETVTGYALKEVSGHQATDFLLGSGSNEQDVETIAQSIEQCLPYKLELLLYNKAGRPFWARIDVHPLFTDLGAVSKWVGLGFDITEQRYAAQMQVDFISMVSHELRTPLTVVSGALEALSMKSAECTPEMITMMVEMGQRNCQQLDKLICDLLDINKLQSGTLALKCEELALPVLVRETVKELQPLAERRNISLAIEHDDSCSAVFVDPMRVTQVVTNLISNAIKFSMEQTEIIVTVRDLGHMNRVSVTDQGRGIPESFQPMVFRQFSRDPGVEAEGTEGFGLGLSICKRLVEQMEGSISFDSTVGQGTCFFFDLPVSRNAALPQPDPNATQSQVTADQVTDQEAAQSPA
jgi:PAS domain S-box-containing protein